MGTVTTPSGGQDQATDLLHTILLGDQYINWPIPDHQAHVTFVPEARTLVLPMDIASGRFKVAHSPLLTIAAGPFHRWNKPVVRQWVLDICRTVLRVNEDCTIRFASMLPSVDHNRMTFIDFNRNLAHSVDFAWHATLGKVKYLPVHKVILGSGYVPIDGIPERWQIWDVRNYILKSAK